MIGIIAALLTVWFAVPGNGEIVAVELRARYGVMGDSFVLEADNTNDTPSCSVGGVVRVCRVTASPITQISVDWSPQPARCGRQPTLIATAGSVELSRTIAPLPVGMHCAYLPQIRGAP